MSNLEGEISYKIYGKTDASFDGEVSVSGKMLKLLSLLDGQTNIAEISRKMDIGVSDMRMLLSKLLEYGLIEEVQENIQLLDYEFFGYTSRQLSKITGPIAQVMVEDAVKEISAGTYKVPIGRASEFIDMLGRQIPDEKRRSEFIRNVLEKLKEI